MSDIVQTLTDHISEWIHNTYPDWPTKVRQNPVGDGSNTILVQVPLNNTGVVYFIISVTDEDVAIAGNDDYYIPHAEPDAMQRIYNALDETIDYHKRVATGPHISLNLSDSQYHELQTVSKFQMHKSPDAWFNKPIRQYYNYISKLAAASNSCVITTNINRK